MTETPVSTTARASAPYLAWGTFLCVVAPTLLVSSWYAAGVQRDYGTAWSVPLAWVGWVLLGVGAILLAVGVLRFAEHADRAAGVKAGRPFI
jgi:hypothetical protein